MWLTPSEMQPLRARFHGTRSIPIVEILASPTAVLSIEAAASSEVGALWVKRDDLTAEPYGGNKIRKLEFHLGQARAQGARTIITFGALGSNHVLATAIYGARAGFQVHSILTPQRTTPYLARNLAADVAAGATLYYADDADGALRQAAGLQEALLRRDDVLPAVIPFGGTSSRSTIGFVNAAFELAEQVVAGELPEPDVVFVPLGSMGTAAGLAVGFAAAEMKTKVVGVRVIPAQIANESVLESVVDGVVSELRRADGSFPLLRRAGLALEIRDGFLGDEYAHATDEALEAVDVAKQSGIALETTYTGKTLAALLADAREGSLRNSNVLFWNTYNSRPVDPPSAETLALAAERVPSQLRAYLEGDLT